MGVAGKFCVQLLVIVTSISQGLCQAEKEAKVKHFVGIVQVGYLYGIGTFNIDSDITAFNRGKALRLRLTASKPFGRHLMIGIGAGLDGYHDPQYNTLPVVLDAKYFLTEKIRSLFVSVNSGMALKLSENFTSGFTGAFNVGYRVPSGRRARICLEIGLNIQQFSQVNITVLTPFGPEFRNDTFILKTFAVNVGILF
ncbi:MAG TPA: hypothetical protein DCE81_04300 [Cytophagales bacterium]|nr:hypothetical protein [Cytophagales bacterium]